MKTLDNRIDDLRVLYGRRNEIHLSRAERAFFLDNTILDLFEMERKRIVDPDIQGGLMASAFSRLCCLADSFSDLNITNALAIKYPDYGCAYCGQKPCECGASRTAAQQFKRQPPSGVQTSWSFNRWCQHMGEVYGPNNEKRGLLVALVRLNSEILEAKRAFWADSQNPRIGLSTLRDQVSLEFADSFAWIFSTTFLLGLDLEPLLEERYAGGCRTCHTRPCECGILKLHEKSPFAQSVPVPSS